MTFNSTVLPAVIDFGLRYREQHFIFISHHTMFFHIKASKNCLSLQKTVPLLLSQQTLKYILDDSLNVKLKL